MYLYLCCLLSCILYFYIIIKIIEILGAPKGDVIFCAKFLAEKRAKAVKLLSRLSEVGALDPQNALLLLRQCASFCKLIHLAQSTPPSLVSEGLDCLMTRFVVTSLIVLVLMLRTRIGCKLS